jgi:hypothetical protein
VAGTGLLEGKERELGMGAYFCASLLATSPTTRTPCLASCAVTTPTEDGLISLSAASSLEPDHWRAIPVMNSNGFGLHDLFSVRPSACCHSCAYTTWTEQTAIYSESILLQKRRSWCLSRNVQRGQLRNTSI